MKEIKVTVAVVGIGTAGFGCAYTLLKNGVKTALIEKNNGFGGTSVFGGVNCWEPGVCDGELHNILADKLFKIPNACAVCKTIPGGMLFGDNDGNFDKYPWGLSVTDENGQYSDTLKRCLSLTGGKDYRRFQFEPKCMDKTMQDMISKYSDNAVIMINTEFVSCKVDGRCIRSIDVKNKDGITRIYADYFVDSTGDIYLSRAAGCETTIGAEGKVAYNELSAIEDKNNINGVTYVFRLKKLHDKKRENEPSERMVISCFNLYPNGDINVNMLPTFKGSEYLLLGDNADSEGKKKILEYWDWLKKEKGLDNYELEEIFPQAGIREGYRLVGRYVLTENDVISGRCDYSGKIAAMADHPIDMHGGTKGCTEIEKPYAIPMECLMPKEIDNMLVACRGASFSHIAASSARLSRTMLTLGESAGMYIAKKLLKGKYNNE